MLSLARLQDSIDMTEEQQRNVMDARAIYIKKVGQALLERQAIRRQLQVASLKHFCLIAPCKP